jgi:hypothetical protein
MAVIDEDMKLAASPLFPLKTALTDFWRAFLEKGFSSFFLFSSSPVLSPIRYQTLCYLTVLHF